MNPDSAGAPLDQRLEALERALRRSERTLRQTQRERLRAENLALRSKQAILSTNRQLQTSIGELERAMQALSEAKAAAERASAAKGRFLATISHELRTPMNGILGSAELLGHASLDPEQSEFVSIIHRSALGLLTIINDVLDFSKAESGRIELESARFDLRAALRAIVDLQLNAARRKQLVLSLRIAPDVPRWVVGDPVRLRQVLLNLLDNAIKFTPEGGVTLFVELPLDAEGFVQFAVEDSGIGIPLEMQEKIFDPFVQADSSTTRRFGGSGLGLAICRHFVTLMGGKVELQSSPGKGTRFHFRARLAVAERVDAIEEPKLLPETTTNIGLRVLVVDDNQVNRLIATRMLERLGCATAEAADGRIAVDLVREGGWDVVLMDCSMPVLDGYEATAEIRALGGEVSRIRIVATTAHAFPGDLERCLAAGMDDYISKPMQLGQLQELLKRILSVGSVNTPGTA